MVENMRNDRAATQHPTSFEIRPHANNLRQRVRPAMDVTVEETCPTCGGSGKIKSSPCFTDTLESKISFLVNNLNIKKFDFTCTHLLQLISTKAS